MGDSLLVLEYSGEIGQYRFVRAFEWIRIESCRTLKGRGDEENQVKETEEVGIKRRKLRDRKLVREKREQNVDLEVRNLNLQAL